MSDPTIEPKFLHVKEFSRYDFAINNEKEGLIEQWFRCSMTLQGLSLGDFMELDDTERLYVYQRCMVQRAIEKDIHDGVDYFDEADEAFERQCMEQQKQAPKQILQQSDLGDFKEQDEEE